MCKIFWPKFNICDLICRVYILCELVYNILHNNIQIWTFDSNNRIDMLWEFNYVIGFFIRTDSTFNSNSFTKSFQHLTSQKIVPCLRCPAKIPQSDDWPNNSSKYIKDRWTTNLLSPQWLAIDEAGMCTTDMLTVLSLGFRKGLGSNVRILKVQNGEYGGADKLQKLQNFVRPSK